MSIELRNGFRALPLERWPVCPVRERIGPGLGFNAEVQVIDGFDGDGSLILDRRMWEGINDERLAPIGGASERRKK